MAVYNNRYYPDGNAITWQDLADESLTWADGDVSWITWGTTSSTYGITWSYTTTAYDAGSRRDVVPETSVEWDRSEPVTITYMVSDDDITYTEESPGLLSGRYFKTKVSTAGEYLTAIQSRFDSRTRTETYTDVDTSTLPGSVSGRQLDVSNFSGVSGITVSPGTGVSKNLQARIVSVSSGTVTFTVRDLDTWDQVAIDAVVNILITGAPSITVDADRGIVSVDG
jgi:hypothetical protein